MIRGQRVLVSHRTRDAGVPTGRISVPLALGRTGALVAMILILATPARSGAEFDRATRLTQTGDIDAALAEYEAFLESSPDDRLAPVAAAAIANLQLATRHDTTAAMAAFDRVLTDYRTSEWAPEAARQKAACAEARREWAGAGESYQLAVDLAVGLKESQRTGLSSAWINSVTLAAANCFHEAGDRDKIIATYENVLAHDPPNEVAATALYRLGESYESAGQTTKAAHHYVQVVEEYPGTGVLEQAMAKRELVDGAMEFDWELYDLYVSERNRAMQGAYLEAIAGNDRILAESDNPALREVAEYAKIQLETAHSGDYTEGTRRLHQFLADHPNGQRTEMAEQRLREQFEPIADLEASVAKNPEDLDALVQLGQRYVQVRSATKGIEMIERALALDPDNPQTHVIAGYAYMGAQRPEEAVKSFKIYLDENPTDANTLNMIGYGFLGLGRVDEALTYFERYVEVAPGDANAHDSYGEGLMTAGRLEESAAEYEKAVAINPGFTNSHIMLGRVYQQMGESEKAVSAYRRFLELVSTGPQADQARAAIAELEASAG